MTGQAVRTLAGYLFLLLQRQLAGPCPRKLEPASSCLSCGLQPRWREAWERAVRVDLDQWGRGRCVRLVSMHPNEEHRPGDRAPATGHYQLLNVFGTPTERVVHVMKDEPLPEAPRGFTWRRTDRAPVER